MGGFNNVDDYLFSCVSLVQKGERLNLITVSEGRSYNGI